MSISTPGKIVVLSGASGSGKSTLTRALVTTNPDRFRVLTSITTRTPRTSDESGEYEFLNLDEFQARCNRHEFVWDAEVYGNHYAYSHRHIEESIAQGGFSICSAVPNRALQLYRLRPAEIVAVYLLAPTQDELRRRLIYRGEPEESIVRRLRECQEWDDYARSEPAFNLVEPATVPDLMEKVWRAVVAS